MDVAKPVLVRVLTLKAHANLACNSGRTFVSRGDQAHEAGQVEPVARVVNDSECGLGCETFSPPRLVDEEGQFNFMLPVDVPW